MSHEPPIPPASQTTYPIVEAPHRPARTIATRALLIGSGVAAAGLAVAGGIAALFFSRRKPATKPAAKSKAPAKRKSRKTTPAK